MPPQNGMKTHPEQTDGLRSNAERRRHWMDDSAGIRTAADVAQIAQSSTTRASADLLSPKSPPGAPGSNNWTFLGPAAVVNGQAFGDPVISGRILGIEVAPGGNRAYAGAADGGIWRYTRDTTTAPPTEDWAPQDDFIVAAANPPAAANVLSVGDIAVNFGATAAADTIFVGTGEAVPGLITGGPGRRYTGVGVRVSAGGVTPRVWTLEGTNLAGTAIFRLEVDPDNNNIVWAATTNGLFRRPAAAPFAAWTLVPILAPGTQQITDLRISGSTAAGNRTMWAAINGDGVYRSVDAANAMWTRVAGINPNAPGPGRISISADPLNPNTCYALDQRARLYRFDSSAAPIRMRRVSRVPNEPTLFRTQGWYDNVVAVDPNNANVVYIAGAVVRSDREVGGDWEWELSAYRGTVTAPASGFRFGFNTGSNNSEARAHRDPTYVGQGVHGDAHCITFGRDAAGNRLSTDVWIGCDGGVFRSTASGANGTFQSLNRGLATTQVTYFDQHPSQDTVIMAGSQDNGVFRSDGSVVWYEAPKGDGGGTAIDPDHPFRAMAQTTNAALNLSNTGGATGEWIGNGPPINGDLAPPMYGRLYASPAHGLAPVAPSLTPPPATVLFGTDRVWADTGFNGTWVTLPTGTVPGGGGQDVLDGSQIVDIKWTSPIQFWVATQNTVVSFNFVAGVWTRVPALANAGLPGGAQQITSLAVFNAATNDVYVGVGGLVAPHVYRFDNPTSTWVGMGAFTTPAGATPVPVRALAIDPQNTNDLYAATDVGVFRGIRTTSAPPPPIVIGMNFTHFSQGLPEASVIDLDVLSVPETPVRRFLRAATHGRGMWEIELGVAAGAAPDIYTRSNNADRGRRFATTRTAVDPTHMLPTGATVNVDFMGSPDLIVRRGVDAQPIPAFPGVHRRRASTPIDNDVGVIQRHLLRRGFSLGAKGADRRFGAATQTAVRALQRRFRLTSNSGMVDGIVGAETWAGIVGYPPLPAQIDYVQFTRDVRADVDEATRVMIADATGVNRVFLQLSARADLTVAATTVRAVLLVAPIVGGAVPNLPAGFAANVATANTTNWLGASGWVFADAATPFRSPRRPLHARSPQILEWGVDFSALGLPAGTADVVLVSLVSSDAEVLTSAQRNVQSLIEGTGTGNGDRRVAARRLRLDAVIDPTPAPP